MGQNTTVKVSRDTWRRLTGRKQEPGESYDDVIGGLLDEVERLEAENEELRDALSAAAAGESDTNEIEELLNR